MSANYPNMSYVACENTGLALDQIRTLMNDYATLSDFRNDLSFDEALAFNHLLNAMNEIVQIAKDEGILE